MRFRKSTFWVQKVHFLGSCIPQNRSWLRACWHLPKGAQNKSTLKYPPLKEHLFITTMTTAHSNSKRPRSYLVQPCNRKNQSWLCQIQICLSGSRFPEITNSSSKCRPKRKPLGPNPLQNPHFLTHLWLKIGPLG